MSFVKRVIRLLSKPSAVLQVAENAFAYIVFHTRYQFLQRCFPVSDSSKKVLLASLTDIPAYAKWEGMLLLSLRMKGCTPVVLTERGYKWAQRFFSVFGISDFVYIDELIHEVEDQVDYSVVDALLDGELSFKKLLNFTYRDIDCGKAALSTLVRKLRSTNLTLNAPEVRSMLKDAFYRSVCVVHAAEMLFERHAFEAVLFHEKGYTPYGEVYHSAVNSELNVVQYHYAQKPKSFVFKRYNKNNRKIHPLSLSDKSWGIVKALNWDTVQEQAFMAELKDSYESGTWFNRKALLSDKTLVSPQEVRSQMGIDPSRKVAMIFSHVLWDASFFFGESLFDDYEHWLVETVKAACENNNLQWYIKLHPDYVWKMKDMGDGVHPQDVVAIQSGVGTLPDHVRVIPPETKITTYSFFDVIDYCITVRGTVGIEAPCFGIPVFTAGTGRYAGLGITIDSSSQEEYIERMKTIHTYPKMTPEQTSLGRRHAWAVFDKRLHIFHAFELTRKLQNRGLQTCVDIPLRSKQQVEQAVDLRIFADWVMDSRDEDFINIP